MLCFGLAWNRTHDLHPVCFLFYMSYQQLRSYQDGYRLGTVHTHGDFIVLPNLETRTLAPYTSLKSHYPDTEPTSPCPTLIMLNAWLGSDKYKLSSPSMTRPEFEPVGSNPMIWPESWTLRPCRPPLSVLLFYVLAKPKVISGRVSTCDIL